MAKLSPNASYAPIGSSEMQARPSGRSSYDPERLLERNIRQARTAGEQAQSALARETLQNQRIETERLRRRQKIQDFGLSKVEQALGIGGQPEKGAATFPDLGATLGTLGTQQQPALQGGWAMNYFGGNTGSREQNIAQAKQKDPAAFTNVINSWNKAFAGSQGKMMNEQGEFVPVPKTGIPSFGGAPQTPASQIANKAITGGYAVQQSPYPLRPTNPPLPQPKPAFDASKYLQ